jgi:heat shock protein HtpX
VGWRTRGVWAVDRGLVIRMLATLGLLGAIYAGFVALVVAAGKGSVALLVIALTVTAVLILLGPRAARRALGVRLLPPSERPELHERLCRLPILMRMPPARLGFVDSPVPNAFAIGYALTSRGVSCSVVVVTSGLVELLEPEELDAVLAHELAHLRNRDALVLSLRSALAVAALVAALILAAVALVSGKLAELTARLAGRLLPSSGQQVGCLRGCLGLNVAVMALAFGVQTVGALLAAGFYVTMHGLSLLVVLALSR